MRPRRARRAPDTRTVLTRLPEPALEVCVLDLAAPLLARLGAAPSPEAVRHTIEQTIAFWNAQARASKCWGPARPKALNALKRRMTGKQASAADAEAFELLSERWRAAELAFDPRRIGEWSLELGDDGTPRLRCELELPEGVVLELPPPIETRVVIGGRFLDETRIRVPGPPRTITFLGSSPAHHEATVQEDGTVIVRTRMTTAVVLLAKGALPPIGGASVGLIVQGRRLDDMVLSEVRCDPNGGRNDVAVLFFAPAPR